MSRSPSLLARAIFGILRGFLVVISLVVAVIAGGVVIVPLAILAPPLPVILGGLLVMYVLGATRSMADDWHARRLRPPARPAAPAAQGAPPSRIAREARTRPHASPSV